jgi:hypothetical protein
MKKSNDTVGNRFRDLPVCTAVSQPLRHRVPHHKRGENRKSHIMTLQTSFTYGRKPFCFLHNVPYIIGQLKIPAT